MRGAAVNLGGTLAVFEAAERNGIRQVAYASSAAVYGPDGGTPRPDDAVRRVQAGLRTVCPRLLAGASASPASACARSWSTGLGERWGAPPG